MKRILFILFFVFLFLLFSCKQEGNRNESNIVVATDPTWPPMEYYNEDTKELVGFDIDLFNAIAKISNLKFEYRGVEWDGIFDKLNSGDCDVIISSVSITDERKKTLDFSMPYINAGQVVITRFNDDSIKKLDDLRGKKVGVQVDTTGFYEIEKMKNVTLKVYDEISYGIEELDVARIDAVVCDAPPAADYCFSNPSYKDTLKIAIPPFTEEYYGIVVKKGNKELLDKINSGLAKLMKDGTLKKLEDKWFNQ